MVKSEYYRRQADLCLQLALAQRNEKSAIWLVEFAEELKTKAEETAGLNPGSSARVLA
jgi:tRNA1(Val) A37 N6-methylase TrmN6